MLANSSKLIGFSNFLLAIPDNSALHINVQSNRNRIRSILNGSEDRLLVIIGPCSVHDTEAALEYYNKLSKIRRDLSEFLEIVARVYVEKPRTTVGWKGFLNDPSINGSNQIQKGLEITRKLLVQVNILGLPAGVECLNPLVAAMIEDLVSWGAIGARTVESQVHREMASGLLFPIGFKNTTDGNVQAAINSVLVAKQPHCFISTDSTGKACIQQTPGNANCHLILRGGKEPNFDAGSVKSACDILKQQNVECKVIVDASHNNSGKDPRKQIAVCNELARRITNGEKEIAGLMIESNLLEGNQNIGKNLKYGQSITDACISWKDSVDVLNQLAVAVSNGRKDNKN